MLCYNMLSYPVCYPTLCELMQEDLNQKSDISSFNVYLCSLSYKAMSIFIYFIFDTQLGYRQADVKIVQSNIGRAGPGENLL